MEIKFVRLVYVAVLQDIAPTTRPIVVLVANLNSVLVVFRQPQHLHQDLQDLHCTVVHYIITQYVQQVFAVVMTVNVVPVTVIALIHSIAKDSMETAILQRHLQVLQPSTILVRILEVFLIVRTYLTA